MTIAGYCRKTVLQNPQAAGCYTTKSSLVNLSRCRDLGFRGLGFRVDMLPSLVVVILSTSHRNHVAQLKRNELQQMIRVAIGLMAGCCYYDAGGYQA